MKNVIRTVGKTGRPDTHTNLNLNVFSYFYERMAILC